MHVCRIHVQRADVAEGEDDEVAIIPPAVKNGEGVDDGRLTRAGDHDRCASVSPKVSRDGREPFQGESCATRARFKLLISDDFPSGMHFLSFAQRPIDTNQFGNMQLVINLANTFGQQAIGDSCEDKDEALPRSQFV